MTHTCVLKLTSIGSDNGLSTGRRQAIVWTNAGILLIKPLGTNFSEILIEIYTVLFQKMHLKMSSEKWRPLCLGLYVLTVQFETSGVCTPTKLLLHVLLQVDQYEWTEEGSLSIKDRVLTHLSMIHGSHKPGLSSLYDERNHVEE